jgi:hypothetical protein
VLHLHQTLLHQRFQAVIKSADAESGFHGRLAPGEVWVFLQGAHDSETGVFLELGLATFYSVDELSLHDLGLDCFQARCARAL